MPISTNSFSYKNVNENNFEKDLLDYFKKYFEANINNSSLNANKVSNQKYGTIFTSKTFYKSTKITFAYTVKIAPKPNTNQQKASTFTIEKLTIQF